VDVSVGAVSVCGQCGAACDAADSFCEACGTPLLRPPRSDLDLGAVAGVTDRGLIRRRNEDAVRVATVGRASLAVVCDGVASSDDGDRAAEVAVEAASACLASLLASRSGAAVWDPRAATRQAISAAQAAVLEVPAAPGAADPPSCTLVSVLWDGQCVTVGSVGDSRAYWVGSDEARLLSVDDSWAQDRIAAGVLSRDEVLAAPQAHAITRWLGRDAPDGPWRVTSIEPKEKGRIVACSDGLWNYAPDEEQFAALVGAAPDGPPISVAHWLADSAITAGGADNVTVAVVDIDPERVRVEEWRP
jgi:serine/threonine protein phosphatase PrpC